MKNIWFQACFMFPEFLLRVKISSTARLIYAVMTVHCRNNGGYDPLSPKSLCDFIVGLPIQSCKKALLELERHKLVHRRGDAWGPDHPEKYNEYNPCQKPPKITRRKLTIRQLMNADRQN